MILCLHDDCRMPLTWEDGIGWTHEETCPPDSACWRGDKGATPDPETNATLSTGGVTVIITPSAGRDSAIVVFIDTTFEPDRGAWNGRSVGPGLRVLINDDDAYIGVPWEAKEDDGGDS